MKTLEDIYASIGGFGWFQMMSVVIILSPEWPAAMIEFQPIFTAADPKSWICTDNNGFSRDVTNDSLSLCTCNGTLDGGRDTIVGEWKLICGKEWVADFITSVQMAGFVLGDVVATYSADKFGRKNSLYAFCFTLLTSCLLSAFANGPVLYGLARFCCGGAIAAILILGAIYPLEFLLPKHRPLCGAAGPWGEGVMSLALWAYMFPAWRHLCIAIALPLILIFPTYAFLKESPRWLLSHEKNKEAKQVIDTIAKYNGKKAIDPKVWSKYTENMVHVNSEEDLEKLPMKRPDHHLKVDQPFLTSFMSVVKGRGFVGKTWAFMNLWFTCCIIYYGIGFNAKNLSGDPYVNVLFMALLDMIGFHSAILVSGLLGRKLAVMMCMTTSSLLMIVLISLEITGQAGHFPGAFNIFSFGSRMCSAACLAVVECFTAESYSTKARATAVMLSNFAASSAAIISPQMAFLGSYYRSAPYFVFAFFSVLSTISTIFLRETSGKPLQENL